MRYASLLVAFAASVLAGPMANPDATTAELALRQAPNELSCAINAPSGYLGLKTFPGPYNPAQCANACTAQTAYNQKHPAADGSYSTCEFFNSYVLSKNGAPQGTYCGLYTQTWSTAYATNCGQYRGSDYYSVSQSYGWSLNQD